MVDARRDVTATVLCSSWHVPASALLRPARGVTMHNPQPHEPYWTAYEFTGSPLTLIRVGTSRACASPPSTGSSTLQVSDIERETARVQCETA